MRVPASATPRSARELGQSSGLGLAIGVGSVFLAVAAISAVALADGWRSYLDEHLEARVLALERFSVAEVPPRRRAVAQSGGVDGDAARCIGEVAKEATEDDVRALAWHVPWSPVPSGQQPRYDRARELAAPLAACDAMPIATVVSPDVDQLVVMALLRVRLQHAIARGPHACVEEALRAIRLAQDAAAFQSEAEVAIVAHEGALATLGCAQVLSRGEQESAAARLREIADAQPAPELESVRRAIDQLGTTRHLVVGLAWHDFARGIAIYYRAMQLADRAVATTPPTTWGDGPRTLARASFTTAWEETAVSSAAWEQVELLAVASLLEMGRTAAPGARIPVGLIPPLVITASPNGPCVAHVGPNALDPYLPPGAPFVCMQSLDEVQSTFALLREPD